MCIFLLHKSYLQECSIYYVPAYVNVQKRIQIQYLESDIFLLHRSLSARIQSVLGLLRAMLVIQLQEQNELRYLNTLGLHHSFTELLGSVSVL